MKITNVALNMTRESVLSYYELKIKHEERKAFLLIAFIMLGIFIFVPILLTRMILDVMRETDVHSGVPGVFDIFIILSLIIIILAICLTTNAYRCGKLFKSLRKNNNLAEALQYIMDSESSVESMEPQLYAAFLLTFYTYRHSYITEDGRLVIVYQDGAKEKYYVTDIFERLCSKECEDMTLAIDEKGIQIIS